MNKIDKILWNLVSIHKIDSLAHFFYGMIIYLVLSIFISDTKAFIILLAIAILKELYDHWSPHHSASMLDIVYTILPSIMVIVVNRIK